MELITSIILLVFGVLQIILFFKLWGMTNDIRELKKREAEPKSDRARIAYLRGDKGLAQQLMDEHFFETARKHAVIQYHFSLEYAKLVEAATILYEKMDLRAPDFEKYKDKEELVISSNK